MDESRMTAFVEKAVDDVGALLGGSMVVIGDKLGLYRAVASAADFEGAFDLVCFFDCLDDMGDPVGAAYYGFSTLLCTPSSLSRDVGTALGAQAAESRLRQVAASAGFTTFRRVAETPFNVVLEAKAS